MKNMMQQASNQSQVVSDVLDTVDQAALPVFVTLDDLEIPNKQASLPQPDREQYGRDQIDRLLRKAIEYVLPASPSRENLLVSIYDAIELKPGVLGISIDLKRILERLIPDIRGRLSRIGFNRRVVHPLKFLVTPSGCRAAVTVDAAREVLGESQLQSFLYSGLIRREFRNEVEFIELTHDMIAKVIWES